MLDFPSEPAADQVFTVGSTSWRWDGAKWTAVTPGRDVALETTLGMSTGGTLPPGFSGSAMVDTTAGSVTVLLPAAPAMGQGVLVKDAVGQAATHPITVGGNGQSIEGDASKTIAVNYGWLELVYSGVQWVQA